MDISSLSFFNIILFFKFQSFPLLLSIIFLAFWLPLLFIFLSKRNKIFLYLSLAFLFLFIKEVMFYLTAKEIFSNVEATSLLDVTFNQLLLESLFFYFFSYTFFKVFRKIDLPREMVYFDASKLIKTIFLSPLALLVVILLTIASIIYFSEIALILLPIILLAISSMQNSINQIKRNYSFFNVPQIKTETIICCRIFLSIHFFFFLFFFYYLIVLFLEHENFAASRTSPFINYLTNPELLELIIEQYSHPVKSLAYFFLLFFASSLLGNVSFLEKSKQTFYGKADMIQQIFFSKLNEEKLFLAPPLVLLKKSLIWLKEKLNIEYLIIRLPNLSINLVIPKDHENYLKEDPSHYIKDYYFPYIKKDIVNEANQAKTFFYGNLLDLSRPIQEKFIDFITNDKPEKMEVSPFVPANSLMSVPIFSTKTEKMQGHLIAVNSNKTYWEKDFDLLFMESFSKKLGLFLRYFTNYHDNKKKVDEFIKDKIDEKYIKAIKLLERKYNIDADTITHNRDKVEIAISTLFPKAYPNNFYFVQEKEKEIFIFANYFLDGKNRNENILNSLALLSGLSEEFVSSNSSKKTVAIFMKKVNNLFSFLKIEENFISSLAVNYNFASRKLAFSNAAYAPLLSYNSSKDEFWSYNTNGSIPMGLKKGENFEENKITANPGDIFFFLPQSILEKNARGKKFNFDIFYNLIRKNLDNSLEAISEVIKKNVENFLGEKHPNRIIILILKITH